MSAELSADNERFLNRLLETGAYPSRAQAINDALTLLRRREDFLQGLRQSIEEAERGEFWDAAEVFDRLEARAREIEAEARRQS